MKNPGYKIKPNKNETKTKLYTFIGYVYPDGIAYEYNVKESNKVDANDAVPDPDPSDKVDMAALGAGAGAEKGEEAEAKGGSRRTSRRRRTLRKLNKRKNAKKVTQKKE
jgi:hypothetical protein